MKHLYTALFLLIGCTVHATLIEIQAPEQFDQIIQSNPLVIADFYASWCQPCQQMARPFSTVANESGLPFIKINIDGPGLKRTLFANYNVHSMPTLIIFRNGQPTDVIKGTKTLTQLRRLVDRVIAGQRAEEVQRPEQAQ